MGIGWLTSFQKTEAIDIEIYIRIYSTLDVKKKRSKGLFAQCTSVYFYIVNGK